MNIERGLKRLSYVFICATWIGTLLAFANDGPAMLGQCVAYLLVFTLCYMLLFNVMAWALRGFKKD